jgi:hypothetical protein
MTMVHGSGIWYHGPITKGESMNKPKLVIDNSNKTETRENRFSGESFLLTKEEAKIHDSIFYYEYLATLEDKKVGVDGYSKLWDKVRKGLDYFRHNNTEAYMVLLD